MKKVRFIFILIIILNLVLVSGCWNYREIDKLLIVLGAAVDKGSDGNYLVTVEVAEMSSGKESAMKSKTITMEGDTIFDAVRNVISISGERLYWSHVKQVIISQDIAKEGIVRVLDWFSRDAETRSDIHVLISAEKTAKEILESQGLIEKVNALAIDDMLKNQKSLSKFPPEEIWMFINEMSSKGIDPTAPIIKLVDSKSGKIPQLVGSALFRGDKLTGVADDIETMCMLFVKDQVKGGVLVLDQQRNGDGAGVTFEIFHSNTKVQPLVDGGNLEMNITIKTEVTIDEVGGVVNITKEEERKKLEQQMEQIVTINIENFIKKVQYQYGVDIFGFGAKLAQDKPREWEKVSANWRSVFKELKVNVDTDISVKNTAMLSKTLDIGE